MPKNAMVYNYQNQSRQSNTDDTVFFCTKKHQSKSFKLGHEYTIN